MAKAKKKSDKEASNVFHNVTKGSIKNNPWQQIKQPKRWKK